MKNVLLIATVLLLTACGGGKQSSAGDASTDTTGNATVDTIYRAAATDSLLALTSPNQAAYAAMIEQCRAINHILTDKLAAIDFRSDMTDAEIDSAMAKLQNDRDIPQLEEHSRALLLKLQNADLDEANRARYDRMVADAASDLARLQ